jgi:hypothetical protein
MMKYRVLKGVVFATALAFSTSLMQLPMALASPSTSKDVDVEITVRVNEKGFLDQKGKVFGPKNILTIPHGKVVRMTFVFDEEMSSLAYGDTHQVAITGEGLTKESGKIWMFNQKTSIAFQVGKEGAQYRAYCILDCIGMEHLNNLVIQVV